MNRLSLVNLGDASSQVRDGLAAARPLGIFRVMANAESAFPHWMRWTRALLDDLALDPLLRELAILRVATLTPHAQYEWVQHVVIARSVGVDEEQIDALRREETSAACLSADQRLVLRFVAEVVRDVRPSDEAFTELARRFSAAEIVELLMVIGQYMMIARVVATAELEPDEALGDVFIR